MTPELREKAEGWYEFAVDAYELGFDIVWFVYTTVTPQYYYFFDGVFIGEEVFRTYIKTWDYYQRVAPSPEPEANEALDFGPREGAADITDRLL